MTDTTPTNLDAVVAHCRKLLRTDLTELAEELGPIVASEARERASASRDHTQRSDYLKLQIDVQTDWHKYAPAFAAHLDQRLQVAARSPLESDGADNLTLLTDEQQAEQLAMREVVDLVRGACAEEGVALERRVQYLANQQQLPPGYNPFRVADLCDVFEAAAGEIFPDPARRLLLLKLIGRHLEAELPPLLRAINEAMIEADVLPALKRAYRNGPPVSDAAAAESAHIVSSIERLVKARTAAGDSGLNAPLASSAPVLFQSLKTAAPPPDTAPGTLTNVVRLARDSDAARHVQPQEAVTLDIVSALFDLIFGDEHVAEDIKSLVSRLQFPVLKVAMLSPQFFSDRRHPARRFLDSLSGVAIRWGKAVDASDPFYAKLAELVERIHDHYDADAGIFEAAITELGGFINAREAIEAEANRALAESVKAREEEINAQREGQARAQLAADLALVPLVTDALPEAIAHFLTGAWRDVLQARIYSAGKEAPAAQAALSLAQDLLWSIEPKKDADSRKRHMALLPVLLKGLNAGLDETGITAGDRREFMDALVELHLAALRAEARRKTASKPKVAKPAEAARSGTTLQVSHATPSGVRIQDISVASADALDLNHPDDRACLRRVRQMVRGDWVDFSTMGKIRRERLTWINPSRTLLLFSNHAAECAISITPEALALRLRNRSAKLAKRDTAMFERALKGAVQSLQAA